MRMLILPAMTIMALVAGCGQQPDQAAEVPGALAVDQPWVRLAAVPGRPGAAYFTIKGGATAERLVRIEADKVATIELHQGGMKDGVMTMTPIAGVDVPAGGEAAFAPGGNHAMLFGVDPSVAPGGTLPLRFGFASGKTINAEAKVIAAGDDAPGHGGH